jgi:L-alanine-DL-glutamate epimerase-like enolase superfamily enzyme
VKIVDGHWPASERPGIGLAWDAKAVERYRIA